MAMICVIGCFDSFDLHYIVAQLPNINEASIVRKRASLLRHGGYLLRIGHKSKRTECCNK